MPDSMARPTHVTITTQEEGFATGETFKVIGWTGFDQPVIRQDDGVLLVLQPDDFVASKPQLSSHGTIISPPRSGDEFGFGGKQNAG